MDRKLGLRARIIGIHRLCSLGALSSVHCENGMGIKSGLGNGQLFIGAMNDYGLLASIHRLDVVPFLFEGC
jgi:hypothetical protein